MRVGSMDRLWTRVSAGSKTGAAIGVGVGLSDLTSAAFTTGALFDATEAGWLLLGLAMLLYVGVGVGIGGTASLALPVRAFRCFHGPRKTGAAVLGVAILTIAGVALRTEVAPDSPRTAKKTAARGPDVLLVVVDTLRADTVYGSNTDFPIMPHLRRWAQQSVFFTEAEATSGWTLPSIASLFTGINPTRIQAERRILLSETTTLAEHFADAGYRTHGYVDNVNLAPRSGFAAGFHTWFRRSALRFALELGSFRLLPSPALRMLRQNLPVAYYGCDRLTEQVRHRLRAPASGPHFYYVHYMDPHLPHRPHPDFGPPPPGAEVIKRPDWVVRQYGPKAVSAGQRLYLKTLYENEVRAVDRCLGRLLDAWKETTSSSVVAVLADHGEEFLDHGELWHGHTLYPELVRVPMLLRTEGPGVPPLKPRQVDTPVSMIDVAPTLLDLAGLIPSPNSLFPMEGISWVRWLQGHEAAPMRSVYAHQTSRGRQLMRWRQGPWALIETSHPQHEAGIRLFFKTEDPTEHRNRTPRDPARANSLQQRLQQYVSAQDRTLRDPNPSDVDAPLEALKALGYIQ